MITQEAALHVIQTAQANGRQVTIATNPDLHQATAELDRARTGLANAQAIAAAAETRYLAAQASEDTRWTGTALKPALRGQVMLVAATRLDGPEETRPDDDPIAVVFDFGRLTAITESTGAAAVATTAPSAPSAPGLLLA